MKPGRITAITGAPGTGKTAVAAVLAEKSEWDRSVHLHTDDSYRRSSGKSVKFGGQNKAWTSLSSLAGASPPASSALPHHVFPRLLFTDFPLHRLYQYICKGAVPPHLPESREQNLIVIEAFLEAAKRYARGGYDVVVDGIIGPWFLAPWLKTAREGYEMHYIILRADREETMERALGRSKLDRETNLALVEAMWGQFQDLGQYEANVIDTTGDSLQDTVSAVQEKRKRGTALL